MDNSMFFQELNSGEVNGVSIIEITSIPHANIISGVGTLTHLIETKRKNIQRMLSEIYQLYKNRISEGTSCEISLELLWMTTKVENQPYEAKIRLFFVARLIGENQECVCSDLDNMVHICANSLVSEKYGVKYLDYEEFLQDYSRIKDSSIVSIVKDEALNDLQNPILPVCYSYDVFPEQNDDLSSITKILTQYPDCAVSIQLMTTYYTAEEGQQLGSMAQTLGLLEKGVQIDPMNNLQSSLAEKYVELYQYYEGRKRGPLFFYNIVVYGDAGAVNNIAPKVYGFINADSKNPVAAKFITFSRDEVNRISNFYPLPWALNELLLQKNRNNDIWSSGLVQQSSFRLPYIITEEEASNILQMPVGSDNVGAGLPVDEVAKNSKSYAPNVINSSDISVGKIKSSADQAEIGFNLNDLTKHMLIAGAPGCGKTTFSVSLLDRLWKEHKIPFLVIEPAKNEYRAMVESIPDLQVFTPGKNFISPFVFNPFLPPRNVKLETFKSTLKTAFAAAVTMASPLDKIFEEAINNCYSDFRWLDTYTRDDEGRVFNISDFIRCFQYTFDGIGYTGDARNIGRAGVVRLNSLVNLFDNYYSIPIEDLLTKPTVIELTAIENSDEKALIIALILLSILAYINANYIGEGNLKNVILLEEAHVLFDAESHAGEGGADPGEIAKRLIKRMLAEARAYGVGLVIADQSPRKVTSDVVGLTDIKLAFRLVEAEDKRILADSTNMDEIQRNRLSKLKPGEAFLFYHKLEEPEELKTEDYRDKNNIDITITDQQLAQKSSYWRGKEKLLKPYPECSCIECCSQSCFYARRILARDIARRIFVKNFKASDSSFDPVKKVFANISNRIKAELNSEPFDQELLSCVKVHLWRRIKYDTSIPVSEKLIANSLRK